VITSGGNRNPANADRSTWGRARRGRCTGPATSARTDRQHAGSADATDPTDDEYLEVVGHATFVTGLILNQAPGATVEVRRVLEKKRTAGRGAGQTVEYSGDCWTVAQHIVTLGSSLDVLKPPCWRFWPER